MPGEAEAGRHPNLSGWLFHRAHAPAARKALAVVAIENMMDDRSLEWLDRMDQVREP
jgi:hypothetical protein